ncbi:Zinc finger CCCH domain-containing protein 24 [Camellia lanceoleosa]|uniref:Zinc finger CCCH domain-containing protein 24 n=1 Tax=Camellia lanceoleosa TaxID=1840588 RepID=A0ACC0H1Y6_9ERIC|nr:Zinc finger CCCH domain-containing protein 24 [Camellia lanceoleosa]
MFKSANRAYFEFSELNVSQIEPYHYQGLFHKTIYESDEFRMYCFKIKPCTIVRCHDWIQCPFAHKGEKVRRRDPCKYNYAPIPCPNFNRVDGTCLRGDMCQFAHGVFECWLHPVKYRTEACYAGELCNRKVCFFAHKAEELREKPKIRYVYRVKSSYGGDDALGKGSYGHGGSTSAAVLVPEGGRHTTNTTTTTTNNENCDFLASLSGLKIRGGDETGKSIFGWSV